MHGLINRSIQSFVSHTYGAGVWADIARDAGLDEGGFEAMLPYEDALTYRVLDAAEARLSKGRDTLLEDLGTYLISNPHTQSVRRLLRFGGVTFEEFLHSLDDLHDRARLAVPELDLPEFLLLGDRDSGGFYLVCKWQHPGFGHVMMGALRAMADDYGALVFLEYQGGGPGFEMISVVIVEASYADGRDFSLAGQGTEEAG